MYSAQPDDAMFRLHGIVKEFPGVRALGPIGAGRSRLIKVLSGAHRPDAWRITWLGDEASFASPQAAVRGGIATVYRKRDLVEGLSVAAAREAPARLGRGATPVQREVAKLPSAAKQIVSTARALSRHARLLIADVLHRS